MLMRERARGPILVAMALALVACGEAGGPDMDESEPAGDTVAEDSHSYARPGRVRVTHLSLELTAKFDERVLEGEATLSLERTDPAAPLMLDTRDLEITAITAGTAGAMTPTTWQVGERDENLGSPLRVDLPQGADRVMIAYRTSPSATGLQWLEPAQTAGGKHPFLYTQSQAIHARSWIPCQDSPGVRVTFDAVVRVPAPLRAVMAAGSTGEDHGVHEFEMRHSIPSYLIALAIGDLAFGEIGPRTGVWAEPSVLPAAVDEFADMERMLVATEALYGPYRWDRYDLLVLPPSFPFGGMENPMLTFATPTILAGDRSLVSLVAHELAHSWSGNLVTNATWSDFWLNEGFTTYLERRIMESVYGPARAEMEWMLGKQDLIATLEGELADKPGDQILEIDLEGRDPDDGFSDVPYDKGALFLRLLEERYGREAFDPFLQGWFDRHAFESVTTDDFRAYLAAELIRSGQAEGEPPDVEAWLTQPGLPDTAPEPESLALELVDAEISRWAAGEASAKELDTDGWTTHHWRHFLRNLPETLTPEQMGALDEAFGFTGTGNAEVLDEWLVLAVRHDYVPARDRMTEFLTRQGRRKFLTPLYREMVKTESGQRMAMEIYTKARPMYHAISRRTLDPIVGWEEGSGSSGAGSAR